MSRLPFVRIGVIGLGPSWRESLLPAILNTKSRVRVVALYDDLASAAVQQQEPLQASVVHGIRALLARQDIDAIVLRHVGWHADWLVDRLREQHRPLWIGPDVHLSEQQADALSRQIAEEGAIVFPELRLRYLPATLRLQELMATSLGAIVEIVLHAHAWSFPSSGPPPLSHLLDWCTSLIQSRPVAIEPRSPSLIANAPGVRIVFDESRPSRRAPQVEIVWPAASQTVGEGISSARLRLRRPASRDKKGEKLSTFGAGSVEPSASPFCEVTCANGSAVIVSRDELRWTSEGRSGQEKLASDRTAWEVMLDLFARRVSGGLIPTPDFRDLRRAQALADAVEKVCQSGSAVHIDAARG